MVRRCHLVALLVTFCLATNSRTAEVYDLIPADALGGVACRNMEALITKSEKLGKDLEFEPFTQAGELAKQMFAALGLKAGLDMKGNCSLVAVNPKRIGAEFNIRNVEQLLVLTIPFSDLDAMAGNFGFDKGKLKPETMATIEKKNGLFGERCYVKGKYFYLGNQEKAILSVVKGKMLGEELNAARRKALADADCICHLGTEVWGDMWKDVVKNVEREFEDLKDEAERKTAKELVESFVAVRHVFCSCKIDGGVGCSCMCVFPKDGNEAAKKFINTLRGGDGNSTLKGLPAGNVVAASAVHGDGSKNGHMTRVLIRLLLRDVLESFRVYTASDRPAFLATFNEVWSRLRGSRFAIYKTADEQKLGLFSIMAILDVEDASKFVGQLKMLAKLGSADGLDFTSEAGKEKTAAEIEQLIKDLGDRRFQTRESATAKLLLAGEQVLPFLDKGIKSKDLETARRSERIKDEIVQAAEARRRELLDGTLTRAVKPSFAFLDKMEKIDGFEVYQVAVKLSKADAATAPQFKQLLGPEWNRVRIGVQGKQLVILAGSDMKLLSEALRNLKDDKPGLASAAALGDQAKKTEAGRKIEFHVSMAMAQALATAADLAKPGKLPANPPLTTAALTIEEDRLQCECYLPLAELKVLFKPNQ